MPVTATPAHWSHLARAAQPHVPHDFTGQIVLNVHKGTVARVEVRQSFAPDTRS